MRKKVYLKKKPYALFKFAVDKKIILEVIPLNK